MGKALNRHILKALGIFGGSQAIAIVCSFVRNKFAALLLGTQGVGLLAIFNNAIDLLTNTTQLSIRQSAVRDVAKAESKEALGRIAFIVMRWAWILGVIGAFITIAASPWISQYSFGSDEYVPHICILSAVIFIAAIQTGWQIIIQGVNDMAALAKSQVWGSVIGAVVSIPMYYFWGLASILPSLLTYSVATAIATACYRKRFPKPSPTPSQTEILREGISFIKLGFYMTASAFATLFATYIYIGWLSSTASVSEVGLFNAGNTIINRYATLVFAAIGYEYYPRLSRVIDNTTEVRDHVCSEINITLLVILPMICIYLAFNDFFITLLYSSDFTPIVPFMKWAMLGIVLKAISWCMAFTILARGEGRDYIFTEVASSIVYLVSHVYFYNYFGIIGWGYAFLTWYAAYIAIIAYFYFFKYHFTITKTTIYLSLAVTAIALLAIALTFISQIAVLALAVVVSIATLLYIKKIA